MFSLGWSMSVTFLFILLCIFQIFLVNIYYYYYNGRRNNLLQVFIYSASILCQESFLCLDIPKIKINNPVTLSLSSSKPTLSIMLLTIRGFFKICCPIPVLNMSPAIKHEIALISQLKNIRPSQRRKQDS